MAERRMFAKTIVLSDAFLDMPLSARCLYFTFGMLADDDGFLNSPKSVMRQCGACEDDIKLLIAKKFILPFESGVIVIKHWRINNYLRADRKSDTKYLDELGRLTVEENGAYSLGIPDAYHLPTACPESGIPSIGKDSIGKYSIEIEGAAPPSSTRHKYGTYKNVLLSDDDMDKLKAEFPDYEERIERLSDYIAQSGKSYKSHLAVIRNWAKRDKEEKKSKAKETPQGSFDTDDFFAAALAASMGENYGKNTDC